jgi:hypothetical protein
MCSLKLPIAAIEIIDKHRKNCLWRGSEFRKNGYNLAAWNLVQRPKCKGGLGVIVGGRYRRFLPPTLHLIL